MPGILGSRKIGSEAQRGLFGAELARRRAGKKARLGISTYDLEKMLHEARGKVLPERVMRKR